MTLKILLPYGVFIDTANVSRIQVETSDGFYGFLPQRLDCLAAIVPGIFSYEIENQGYKYLALDEGIMVKTGKKVMISVRNAIGGEDLGSLHDALKKEIVHLKESEGEFRTMGVQLENRFIRQLEKFRK